MKSVPKPRIGLLGLMAGGYEPIFNGIIERQSNYAKELVAALNDKVDVLFERPAIDRESVEIIMKEYNRMDDIDGILIVLLTYHQGSWLLRALQENRLPIALAVVQPDQEIGTDWDELRLTVNQGIHGAQDNANMIVRLGIPCQFFVGNRLELEYRNFVTDFAKAAQTRRYLRSMRVAVISRMQGMNDILTDDMAYFKKIGPEFRHETIGTVFRYMEMVSKEDIDVSIKKDHEIFDVDPKMTYERHAEATRMYLGFRRFLEEKGYEAFTAHFDIFSEDGRFKQLPLMAASHLMAEGYGYAAEGDIVCATMVAAGNIIAEGGSNFTEMYTIDFKQNSIIFCHAGEGNWKTCRKDMKPRLIDRYLGEGGLDNPPTPIFTPQYGRATLTSLVSLNGDKFRLILAKGDILAKTDMKNVEMPYIFFKPDSGAKSCVESWLMNGGTHHEVINIGDCSTRWKMLCSMLNIEYVEV
jgi:L-arabinose isomerase